MSELPVAVRELARFCHRSGDIDHRFTPSPSGAEGIAGHQRLARRRPGTWQAEYPVSYSAVSGGSPLLLRGRADGYDPGEGLVEEIKTCRVRFDSIPEAVQSLHWAQAMLYAAVIALQEQRDSLRVRLTWFNIDTDDEQCSERHRTREELQAFLDDALERFSGWVARLTALRQRRDQSIVAMAFPYGEFRPGQREIAELVYKCIDQSGQLLLEAPTGIGKTAAVLFPSLVALARGKHRRLVFTTARTVGRRAAEDTLEYFRGAGFRGSALSLTAREKICFSPGKACHGEDCPFARGYYDRLPEAMAEAIQSSTLRRQEVESLARRFEVCPYQLAQDLLPWVDIVIGDLHYVYSLTPILGRDEGAPWTVLLDEAHNLPGRAVGMYSASLGKAELMALRRGAPQPLRAPLDGINRALLALQKQEWLEQFYDVTRALPARLVEALQRFVAVTGEQMAAEPTLLQRDGNLLQWYFDTLQFLRVAENWGDDFRCELSRSSARQSLVVALTCLDPARLLAQRQAGLHSLTAFSATLSPAHWMHDSLGLDQAAVHRRLPSPFSAGQLQVQLATDVDTRYQQRQGSLPALVQRLQQWLASVEGNCIVYFPSYSYLQDCLEQLQPRLQQGERSLWIQQRNQGEGQREELLQRLDNERDLAAFCILGGVFGEGIDLPGERLSSVVIVGVGLPQFNRYTGLLREHYQQRYGAGFEYAYLYPGMQKVVQALGRVVRGDDDRGSALLIDGRYGQQQYRALLPPWWAYRGGQGQDR